MLKQVQDCEVFVVKNSDAECGAAVALQQGKGMLLLDH